MARLTPAQTRVIRDSNSITRIKPATLTVLVRLGLMNTDGTYTVAGLIRRAELRGDTATATLWKEHAAEMAASAANRAEQDRQDQFAAALFLFGETCYAAWSAVSSYEQNADDTVAEGGPQYTPLQIWGQMGDALDFYGPNEMADSTEQRTPVTALRATWDHLNTLAEAGSIDRDRETENTAAARAVLTAATAKHRQDEIAAEIAAALDLSDEEAAHMARTSIGAGHTDDQIRAAIDWALNNPGSDGTMTLAQLTAIARGETPQPATPAPFEQGTLRMCEDTANRCHSGLCKRATTAKRVAILRERLPSLTPAAPND
jgi:hypothetical protein